MSGWKVGTGAFGTQMVGSRYRREQSGRGQGERVGLDLQSAGCGPPTTDGVCMGLSQEPGSHGGPGLGAQDPLPAPSG